VVASLIAVASLDDSGAVATSAGVSAAPFASETIGPSAATASVPTGPSTGAAPSRPGPARVMPPQATAATTVATANARTWTRRGSGQEKEGIKRFMVRP